MTRALWIRIVDLQLVAGDSSGARRSLQQAAAALNRELGIAPGAELRRLAERLA